MDDASLTTSSQSQSQSLSGTWDEAARGDHDAMATSWREHTAAAAAASATAAAVATLSQAAYAVKAAANAALDPSFMLLHDSYRYRLVDVIGKGSYGVVYGAVDTATGRSVAIKKVKDAFRNSLDAARILRELQVLRLLKHEDVVELTHVCLPTDPLHYPDVWMVFERMESDLHTVIAANPRLSVPHVRVMMYQILRGLACVHRAGVVHRDLKPKNILAMSSCKLKIADFGLARVRSGHEACVGWTDYVATRWYRPPELIGLFSGVYTPAVDVWSVGCICAEMLLRRPLLPGKSAAQQMCLIVDLLGSPARETVDSIPNPRTRAYLLSLPPTRPRWDSVFAGCDPTAVDLLRGLLAFDPLHRITAEQALAHPFFDALPRACTSSAAAHNIKARMHDDRVLARMSAADMRRLVYSEALAYLPVLQVS